MITLEAGDVIIITCVINPNTPPEPTRDKRGRFTKRTGVILASGDCGGVRWTLTPANAKKRDDATPLDAMSRKSSDNAHADCDETTRLNP